MYVGVSERIEELRRKPHQSPQPSQGAVGAVITISVIAVMTLSYSELPQFRGFPSQGKLSSREHVQVCLLEMFCSADTTKTEGRKISPGWAGISQGPEQLRSLCPISPVLCSLFAEILRYKSSQFYCIPQLLVTAITGVMHDGFCLIKFFLYTAKIVLKAATQNIFLYESKVL